MKKRTSKETLLTKLLIVMTIVAILSFGLVTALVMKSFSEESHIPKLATDPIPAYMSVEGEVQGEIEGPVTAKGREGSILVYKFDHEIRVPTDPTGLPTGRRVHSPIKIVKEFDKSSPKLYQALTTGENLKNVELKFYRATTGNKQEHYFTIKLEDALIAGIKPFMPSSLEEQNVHYGHMEEISFTYQKIVWTYEPDGVESEDSWNIGD